MYVHLGSLRNSDDIATLFFPRCFLLDVVRRNHHLPVASKGILQRILQEHAVLCCHGMGYVSTVHNNNYYVRIIVKIYILLVILHLATYIRTHIYDSCKLHDSVTYYNNIMVDSVDTYRLGVIHRGNYVCTTVSHQL